MLRKIHLGKNIFYQNKFISKTQIQDLWLRKNLYLHESGRAGIGGILRDEEGGITITFIVYVEYNSNNMAEFIVASYGVELCKNFAHTKYNNILPSGFTFKKYILL